jgi:uroporphyrinogen decarboxylase
MLCALAGGRPDTVPVWELAFNEESIIKLAGKFMEARELPPAKNVADMTDLEVFGLVNAFKVMAQEIGLDGVTATTAAPIERIDAEHFRDGFGVILHQSDKGEPYPVLGPIRDAADLKSYKMRMPEEADFIMIDLMRANAPDQAVGYILNGPFFLSRCLRGSLENLLMDYILNPGLARDLARLCADHNLAALEIIAKKGADFVINDCDLAFNHNTMMSPAQYDEFLHPYHEEIVRRAHELGLKIVKHTDGKIQSLIPRFIAEGFDGLHPIQPQCLDIAWVKREYGKKLCVMGNIDCMYLLVFGTPAEVRDQVKATIAVAAPGGGYVISSSNTLHPGVQPDNYLALVKAAREFGRYPEGIGEK